MNCLGNKLVFPNTIPYGGLKCLFARSGLNPNQARGGGKWPQQTDFRIDLKPSCKLKFVSYIKLTKTMDQFGPWRAFYWPGSSKISLTGFISGSIWKSIKVQEGSLVYIINSGYPARKLFSFILVCHLE